MPNRARLFVRQRKYPFALGRLLLIEVSYTRTSYNHVSLYKFTVELESHRT